jgi:hypothetical protein
MLRRFSLCYLIAFLSVPLLFSCDDELTEGVDIADIPAYYFDNDYLDSRVKAINDAIAECSGGSETFFWITDIHWEPDLNTRKAPLLIKYFASKTGINKILNGGDTGNSQVICKNAIAQLKNAIGSNAVYSVNGNHEINDASRYERPFLRVADELRGHCSDIVYGDGDKSYFYFDNNERKTRYVGLSTFGLYINDDYESCFTKKQLDWFRNTALNVQEGWSIVIFTHSLYHVIGASNKSVLAISGASDFIAAIDEYKGPGTIVCVLMGHSHRDRIHIGTSGVPYIITACDRSSPYNNDINVTRVPGTITEQHFETVIIDKDKRQIKLFSIGGNARDGYDNDPGKEVDVRMVSF